MEGRCTLIRGLLGPKSGKSDLWIHPKNYLASSMSAFPGARRREVPFVDLQQFVGDQPIDVLKVDIEGGEYPFVEANPDIFLASQVVVMEIHGNDERRVDDMFRAIEASGLRQQGIKVNRFGIRLQAWKRP